MKLKWVKVDNREWNAQGKWGHYTVRRNHENTRFEGTVYWWMPFLNGNHLEPTVETKYRGLGAAKQYCQDHEDKSV